MKGWILTSGAFVDDLFNLAGDLESRMGIVKLVNTSEVTYTVENGLPARLWIKNEPCETPDFFMLLDNISGPVAALSNQLISLGSFCYTPIEAKKVASSKIATNQVMARAGLPVAKTMVINKNTDMSLIIKNIGLPIVTKPDDGCGAIDVNLIHTEEELERIRGKMDASDILLAQEFISTSRGRDLRVQVIGFEAAFAIEKSAKDPDEFRSYVKGTGGNLTDVELTDELRELSVKVARAIGLRYCGIDLLYGPEGFIVGEVNSAPGIRRSLMDKALELLLKDIALCMKGVLR